MNIKFLKKSIKKTHKKTSIFHIWLSIGNQLRDSVTRPLRKTTHVTNGHLPFPSSQLYYLYLWQDNVTEWDCHRIGLPVGQHYIVAMSLYRHKLVLLLIWPDMLPRQTTSTTTQPTMLSFRLLLVVNVDTPLLLFCIQNKPSFNCPNLYWKDRSESSKTLSTLSLHQG